MSKILKFFVNLVVLIAIVIAAALLIPPFVGIDTVMNDNTETETNLPVGSVAYGKSIHVNELKKEDKIIYNDGSSTYVYEVTDMDVSAGVYTVKDIYNKNAEETGITLQKNVSKVILAVPYIGYAAIALQSKEGLIVVGLGIIFLIILFVLSEVWRKDDDDEDEYDEDDEDSEDDDEEDDDDEEEELSWKERRRLKKEEKRRRKEEEYDDDEEEEDDDEEEDEDEEEHLSRKERKRLKKEEKRRRKLAKKGLLEEEEETAPAEPEQPAPQNADPQGFDDAMKDAMSAIAQGIAKVSQPEQVEDATIVMPDAEELAKASETSEEELLQTEPVEAVLNELQAELQDIVKKEADEEFRTPVEEEPAEEFQETYNIEETVQEEEIPVNVNAVPQTPSIKELLEKAQAAGEDPKVKEDKENEVTLLDYSDIL